MNFTHIIYKYKEDRIVYTSNKKFMSKEDIFMMNLICNAVAKLALTVAGKEISKKALIIGGSCAGAAAAGTTATILLKKGKKEELLAENEAPIEEAGAEKVEVVENKEATTEVAEAKAEEPKKIEEVKTDVAENKENTTTENTAVQPEVAPIQASQNNVGNMYTQNPYPGIPNPAPYANPYMPNPAFAYAAQHGMMMPQFNMQQAPVTPIMRAPMQQFNPQPQPEIKVQVDKPAEAPKPAEEVVEKVEAEVVDEPTISAADIATGNVQNKINKSKKTKVNTKKK